MTVAVPTNHHTAQGTFMLSAREQMDIISAYQEVGTYRGAAEICGTTPKTVRRVIERVRAGQTVDAGRWPAVRSRNFESVTELVVARVTAPKGRIFGETVAAGRPDSRVPGVGPELPPARRRAEGVVA